jgi:hypothetical protein
MMNEHRMLGVIKDCRSFLSLLYIDQLNEVNLQLFGLRCHGPQRRGKGK